MNFLRKSAPQQRRVNFCCRNVFNVTGTLKDGIRVGAFAEVKHSFPQKDVKTFSDICGDDNPLHLDPAVAERSIFGGTIVHGMLVSSLFSTLFGRTVHGSVYVSQTFNFKRPVHVGTEVTARMEIIKSEERRKGVLLTCSTECRLSDGTIAVEGEATVLIPHKIADHAK